MFGVCVCVCYIQGAYIWNVVSVCTSGGLIHAGGGLYSGGGLIVGGLRYYPCTVTYTRQYPSIYIHELMVRA